MEKLVPDLLKDLWQTLDEKLFTGEQFYYEKKRLLTSPGDRSSLLDFQRLAPPQARSTGWPDRISEHVGVSPC